MIIHKYHIAGMNCGGCVSTVKQKLSSVPGVISVRVDLVNKEAEITSTQVIETGTLQKVFNNTQYIIQNLAPKYL